VASGFDPQGVAAIDWGVTGAPETFLIGRDGTILHKHISPLTAQVWQRDFMPLVQEQCRAAECDFLAAVGGR
jgi:cytochrome c biogenesis protein CcmG/thiol:disulfide interchange protein DsbE